MAGEYDHKAGESLNRISALENYVEFQRKTWIVKVTPTLYFVLSLVIKLQFYLPIGSNIFLRQNEMNKYI